MHEPIIWLRNEMQRERGEGEEKGGDCGG